MCKELSRGHIRVLHESRFWQRYPVAPGTLSHPACTQHFFPCHFSICICQTLSCLQWQLLEEVASFFPSCYWKWGRPVKQTSLKCMKRVEDFYPFIYFKLVCLTDPHHFQYREEKTSNHMFSSKQKKWGEKLKARKCHNRTGSRWGEGGRGQQEGPANNGKGPKFHALLGTLTSVQHLILLLGIS